MAIRINLKIQHLLSASIVACRCGCNCEMQLLQRIPARLRCIANQSPSLLYAPTVQTSEQSVRVHAPPTASVSLGCRGAAGEDPAALAPCRVLLGGVLPQSSIKAGTSSASGIRRCAEYPSKRNSHTLQAAVEKTPRAARAGGMETGSDEMSLAFCSLILFSLPFSASEKVFSFFASLTLGIATPKRSCLMDDFFFFTR